MGGWRCAKGRLDHRESSCALCNCHGDDGEDGGRTDGASQLLLVLVNSGDWLSLASVAPCSSFGQMASGPEKEERTAVETLYGKKV